MLTHYNLANNAMTVANMRSTDPNDVVFGVLPLFHIYGQTSAFNSSIYLGLTIRLWSHFNAEELFSAIEEEESPILIAVPTIFNRLVELADGRSPRRSGLRFCVSGGASLPVEVLRQGACATPEELRQFVKERVAPYKYPRKIQLVKELPKSHTGKILKRAIQFED